MLGWPALETGNQARATAQAQNKQTEDCRLHYTLHVLVNLQYSDTHTTGDVCLSSHFSTRVSDFNLDLQKLSDRREL